MFRILIVINLFLPTFTQAAEEVFEFSSQTSWINQASTHQRDRTVFNPDNTLDLSKRDIETELRPNLKLNYGSHFFGVARPRFRLYSRTAKQNSTEGESHLTEIYGQISLSDDILLAYGKMNYQWGPAELLSPSNRLFKNIEMQPSPIFEYSGKTLVRMNLTYQKHLSFIVLGEAKMSDDSRGETLVVKSEYSLREGSDYAGFVIGRSRTEKNWLGEYLAFTPSDALQFYFDMSHTRGSEQPIAKKNALGLWQIGNSNRPSTDYETRVLLGSRYTSERGNELRTEAFYQTDGYTQSELKDIRDSLQSSEPFHLLNLARYSQNTTSLQGQLYGYLAYRVPDVDAKNKLQITPRYLHSFQDSSGVFFFTAEYNISNAWVTQAVTTYAHGDSDSELAKSNRMSASLALQYSF